MSSGEDFRLSEHSSSPTVISLPTLRGQTTKSADDAIDPPAGALNLGGITSLRGIRRKRRELVPTVVIDKSALFRAGLCHILTGSRFQVAAEHSRLSDASPDLLGRGPGVVIVSLDHIYSEILSEILTVARRNEDLCVLTLGDHLDPKLLLEVFDAGASGYLLRDEISPDAVLKSLELILVGGIVVPHGFTRLLRGNMPVTVPAPTSASAVGRTDGPDDTVPSVPESIVVEQEVAPDLRFARLSDREQAILVHLTQGASNKHIARELNVAEATVKTHIKSLLRKIRVSNRTQAAMWAIGHIRTSEPTAPPERSTSAPTSC